MCPVLHWAGQTDEAGRLALDLALELGEEGVARSLVEHQANLNQTDGEGRAALHLAIQRSDPAAALFLLSCGAQVNLPTLTERRGPLHLLAALPDPTLCPVLEAALTRGADTDLQDLQGETALSLAIQQDNREVFTRLVGAGANLELTSTAGRPALYHALSSPVEGGLGEEGYAGLLLRAGADSGAVCGPGGDTLLHCLATQGREEAGLFLLGEGAAVGPLNRRGETVLHLACQSGLATLATALMVAGADPNIQTNSGAGEVWRQTALHLAMVAGQEAVVSCLLEFTQPSPALSTKTVDLDLRNSEEVTPLALALALGRTHLAQQMVEAGADVNVTDRAGLPLLLKAIKEGEVGAATFLLSHGADLALRSPQGETALELAVVAGAGGVVEKLCGAGADPLASSTGEPVLWSALCQEDQQQGQDLASTLVRHGADPDSWAAGPGGCEQESVTFINSEIFRLILANCSKRGKNSASV